MTLLNTFDLPEANITESNYNQALNELNTTYPDVIQNLNLQTCNLNTFLSEVESSFLSKTFLNFISQVWERNLSLTKCKGLIKRHETFCTLLLWLNRVLRAQAWPLLSSLRPSPRCPCLHCGPSFSLSCSSVSACHPCLETLKESWCLYRT